MEVVRRTFADQFLIDTLEYRAREPVRSNVLGSVAVSVASGHRHYRATWWWLVRDAGRVVGAAFRTEPFGLGLGPMSEAAAALLGEEVARWDAGVPWISGGSEAVWAFLGTYSPGEVGPAAARASSVETQHLYQLATLDVPDVPGSWRRASMADHTLSREWFIRFLDAVNGPFQGAVLYEDDALRQRLRAGALGFWLDEANQPVAMAGHAEPVRTPAGSVVRIGPVFSPETQRRRGYASAATAALAGELLASGATVMLHADAANPTSNAIYQRLGFRLVDSIERVDL